MYDASKLLTDFYENHVRIGTTERNKLAGHRNTNLDRLKQGLDKLSEQDGKTYAHFTRHENQGSYAMRTLNQHPDNDYDIDVAVIFKSDDLPSSPLDARKRVAAALNATGVKFARPPEARTNAVTVWYAEGHHLDFAVYRSYQSHAGTEVLEHGGTDWTGRDPLEVNKWFDEAVKNHSPSAESGASVSAEQFRRVVRFVKAFARSRDSWSLPGGLIISTLVDECFQADSWRDDIALFNTLKALQNRLRGNTSVNSPVTVGEKLTNKTEYENQVKRLLKRLDENVRKLDVLLDPNCTEADAKKAWNAIFYHDFWTADEKVAKSRNESRLGQVKIRVGVAAKEKASQLLFEYKRFTALPKNLWLRFQVVAAPVAEPYEVRWIVQNSGDEAEAAEDIEHESTHRTQWEHTRYKGVHKMICQIIKNGQVVATGSRSIKIGRN